jgi:type IV secretory pathway VirB4 component
MKEDKIKEELKKLQEEHKKLLEKLRKLKTKLISERQKKFLENLEPINFPFEFDAILSVNHRLYTHDEDAYPIGASLGIFPVEGKEQYPIGANRIWLFNKRIEHPEKKFVRSFTIPVKIRIELREEGKK